MTGRSSPAAVGGGSPQRAVKRGEKSGWQQRVDIAARSIAAIVGGYAVSALATALLARMLPTSKIEAAIGPATFSFVIYATIACWAFAARRTWLFCAVLAVIGALLCAMLYGMPRP